MVLLASCTTIFGDESPRTVGVGVVERGGLGRLDIGDVARETILYAGTHAEKNFFDSSFLWCSSILGGNFFKTSSTMSVSNSGSVLAYEKENKELD